MEEEVEKQKAIMLFQFLLVRLRDGGRSRKAEGDNAISIPSGAIKSACWTPSQNSIESLFQFLLVRLRERYNRQILVAILISIPSGAIKSNVSNLKLKAFTYFNSFWCD